MTLRVAVVDDEPLARRRIRRLVSELAGVEVVAEVAGGKGAARAIASARPNLVLLDVQMPERNGFEVAADLPEPRPALIFVTAFDRYAVQAFEVHAVDYLLKPVSRERLTEAVSRARERLESRSGLPASALTALLGQVNAKPKYLERLPIRSQGRIELVDVGTIDWIGAADNYASLHCGRRTHLLRETLAHLERSLDPARFVRIHRSTIVRIDGVVRLDAAQRGDYDATLRDGTTLTLSRTFRPRLERALGRKL